jgi:hypothetical protein
MNSCRNLNRSAFCILSGIPNLWLRTQTSRAAELFVTLNSVNSPAGETGYVPSVVNQILVLPFNV